MSYVMMISARFHAMRQGVIDAFKAIQEDPPLTNYISERIPNSIKHRKRLDELNEQFAEPLETLQEKQTRQEKELAALRAATKENTKEAWG